MKKILSVIIAAVFAAGFCFGKEDYEARLSSLMDTKPFAQTYYDEYEDFVHLSTERENENHRNILEEAFVLKNNEACRLILENMYWYDDNKEFLEEKDTLLLNGKPASILDFAESCGSKEVRNLVYSLCYRCLTYNLFEAYIGKHDDFLRYRLSRMEDINNIMENDYLRHCTTYGSVKMLEFLIANGCDIVKAESLKWIINDNGFEKNVTLETKKQIIDILLKNGENITKFEPNQSWPLIREIYGKLISYHLDQDLLIYLLEKGLCAKETSKGVDYFYGIFRGMDFKGDEKGLYLASLLIKNGMNLKNESSVLEAAAWFDIGDGKLVQFAVDHGAGFEYEGKVQNTDPVRHAFYDNPAALKVLYNAGADFKQIYTLMYDASCGKNTECMDFYLEKSGFKVESKDSKGRTPFWHACQGANPVMIPYFLKKGANPNAVENKTLRNGVMAYFAYLAESDYQKPDFEALNLMLNSGVDLNHKDSEGKTILDYAKLAATAYNSDENKAERQKAIEVVQQKLSGSGIQTKETLCDVIIQNNNTKLAAMLKKPEEKSRIDSKDSNGLCAMDYAVRQNNVEAVKLLMQNGAFLSKDHVKNAIKARNAALLKAFFENGANVNMDIVHGTDFKTPAKELYRTPLYYALMENNVYYDEVESLIAIIEEKPDLSLQENNHGFLYLLFEKYYVNKNTAKIAKAAVDNGEDPFENNREALNSILANRSLNEVDIDLLKYFIDKNDNYKRLFDADGKYLLRTRDYYSYLTFYRLVMEKVLVGKTVTVLENLNLRQAERWSGDSVVIGTLKAGTKVKVTNIRDIEEIDGIWAFWVDVEVPEDTVSTQGKKLAAGTTGFVFSGYLK